MSYSDDEYGGYDSGMDYGGGYGSDEGYGSGMDYGSEGEYEEKEPESSTEYAVEDAPRLVADFEQLQQTTSDFGNLGTRIAQGDFDRSKGKRAKLLELLKIISATPEKRFEVFLLQEAREFSRIIPDKFFSMVQGVVSNGLVPNYGRYSPLGMVLGLMALSGREISAGQIGKIQKILENTDNVDMAVVLKYARWWQDFMRKNPMRLSL